MSAKTFYLGIGVFSVAGIIMAAANANNQSYTGKCWFMGGAALFVLAIVVLMMVLGLRRKTSSSRSYLKRMPLAGLSMDDETKQMTTRYIEGGRVMTKILPQSAVRIVIDEGSKSGRVAVLEIDGLEEYYDYRFWFIKWPEKIMSAENYTLLISRPLDEILDFYATHARR